MHACKVEWTSDRSLKSIKRITGKVTVDILKTNIKLGFAVIDIQEVDVVTSLLSEYRGRLHSSNFCERGAVILHGA